MVKKISVILIIIILTLCFINTVNAADINTNDYKIDVGDGFEKAWQFIGAIAGVVQVIGVLAGVGALIIMGTKYVTAAGGEGKAEIKKTLLPYVIGAVILFSAVGLIEVIENVTKQIFK